MKITFFSNFFNHHQESLSQALFEAKDVEYYFVATKRIPQARIDLGYTDRNKLYPFIICSYESEESSRKAHMLAETSDIVIIGSASDSYIENRLKNGKLTFKYSERFFKNGINWKNFINRWACIFWKFKRFEQYPLYVLCASAYTSADVNTFANFKGRCFKWGYFTKVNMDYMLEASESDATSSEMIPLMWCARFLNWKHPELPVKLARCLKEKGYKFSLDMYGTGVELERTKKLARDLDVCDVVNFCGVLPNEQILEQMKKHEVFLFTSDFNEGWGAVLNEAMSCGCAVVASHAIGSVPFLIQDGINGLIYENENLYSLTEKVEFLLTHPSDRFSMRQKAILTMQKHWNATVAANRFIELVRYLLNAKESPHTYSYGICSLSNILKNNWYTDFKVR